MDLSELINNAKGDRSLRDLARASQKTDHPLSAATWHQLASPGVSRRNFPDPPTIRTIAATLGVPQRVVILAAAESLGLDVTETTSPLASLLPAGARQLTDRQTLAVLAVIQSFLDPGLPDPADDVDEFVLPDVTAPPAPHEPPRRETRDPATLRARRAPRVTHTIG